MVNRSKKLGLSSHGPGEQLHRVSVGFLISISSVLVTEQGPSSVGAGLDARHLGEERGKQPLVGSG